MPGISAQVLRKMASISSPSAAALEAVIGPMLSPSPPYEGFPGPTQQSGLYPGGQPVSLEEAAMVAQVMSEHSIAPANTRLRKSVKGSRCIYDVLQASVESDAQPATLLDRPRDDSGGGAVTVRLVRGDHADELAEVCAALSDARRYAVTEHQTAMLTHLMLCFTTGDMNAFKDAQRLWVMDKSLRVDGHIGFHEADRDPFEARAMWSATVGITDPHRTAQVSRLIDTSALCLSKLPWVPADGMGDFHNDGVVMSEIDARGMVSNCAAYHWVVQALPNDPDVRHAYGSKTVIMDDPRWARRSQDTRQWLELEPDSRAAFDILRGSVYNALQALTYSIGWNSLKLLAETAPGQFNFDRAHPPISPLTGKPIESWFRFGQSPETVFEGPYSVYYTCRIVLVALCLGHHADITALLGFSDASGPATADECE